MNSLRSLGRLAPAGAAAAIMLFGGATTGLAADNPEQCNEGGRAICITINDTDAVSPSTTAAHYMRNTVKVRNDGRAALTNIKVRIVLTDEFDRLDPPTSQASTADYLDSTAACSEDLLASHVLNCTSPNLAAGASITFEPLVFRTSNSPGVLKTRMTVEVTAKEGGSDQPKPKDPTDEQFSSFEITDLEGDENAQRSWVFPGASVTLETTKIGQYSTFPVTVPTGPNAPSFVAELVESTSPAFCPGCFGERITTVATGIFNATNIVEIQTVIPLANVPSSVTEKGLTVLHQPDFGDPEEIKARCSGAIDSGTPATGLSCARVAINRRAGTLTIEAFSKLGNGQWGFF